MVVHVRDGWRRWRQTPGVAAMALVSLSLAMGANTAMFGVLNALFLRPLPVLNPEQLVSVREEGQDHRNSRVLLAVWEAIARRQTMFSGIAAYAEERVDISYPGEPVRSVDALIVSDSYFDTIGVRPRLGRLFSGIGAEEAVISEHAWQTVYGSDRLVVGRKILVNRQPFTVVGVTGEGFFGTETGRSFGIAVRLGDYPALSPSARTATFTIRNQWLRLIARLPEGVSRAVVEGKLQALQASVRESTAPSAQGLSSHLRLPWELEPTMDAEFGARSAFRRPIRVLSGIALLILLIACANIASLQLSRASARRIEVAARLALGSSRATIFWQLVVESVLLIAVASAGGLAIGYAVRAGFIKLLSTETRPLYLDDRFDWTTAAFTSAVLLLATLVSAVMPAWQTTRVDPGASLRGFRDVGRDVRRFGPVHVVITVQMALTFVLVFSMIAVGQTLRKLTSQDYGFYRNRIVNVSVDVSRSMIGSAARRAIADALRARLAEVDGVDDAALVFSAPFGTPSFLGEVNVPGRELGPETNRRVQYNYVGEQYFRLMGTPIIAGTSFEDVGRAMTTAAVVNEAFVRRFLRDVPAVGRAFTLSEGAGEFQVIGVAGDMKVSSLREPSPPIVYLPWQAETRTFSTLQFSVRRREYVRDIERRIVDAVEAVVAGAAVKTSTLDAQVEATLVSERAVAAVSTFFAVLAVILATVGLYGAMSYNVTRRTSEIGLRVALGATPRHVYAVIVNQIVVVVLVGMALGGFVAAGAGTQLGPLLYGVRPAESSLFLVAALIVVACAVLAAYLPARRAIRLDAMRAIQLFQ